MPLRALCETLAVGGSIKRKKKLSRQDKLRKRLISAGYKISPRTFFARPKTGRVEKYLKQYKKKKRLTYKQQRFLFQEYRRLIISGSGIPKGLDRWYDEQGKKVDSIITKNTKYQAMRDEIFKIYSEASKTKDVKKMTRTRIVYVPNSKRKPVRFFTLDSYERFIALKLYSSRKKHLYMRGKFGIVELTPTGKIPKSGKKVKFERVMSEKEMIG